MEELKKILIANNLKISVAESCTGGNLQSILTSIGGSSEYFEGGITCYTIDQKVKHLLVNRELAESVDCVSQEIADEMVLGCSKLFETNISISTTGYITSHLYYSISIENEIVMSDHIDLSEYFNRNEAQKGASKEIIKTLVNILKNRHEPNNIGI
jgi:PncC family amidohydrolase